jgi:hypothetical protein
MFATADDFLEQGLRKSLHAPNWNMHVAPQFPTMMPWRTQLNESHVHDLGEMGSLLHEIFGNEVHATRTESDNRQRDHRLPSPSVSRVVFEAALAVGRRARQPSTPDIEGDQTLEHMVLNASQREELVNFFLEPSEASMLDPHRVLDDGGIIPTSDFVNGVAEALEVKLAPVWATHRDQRQEAGWNVAKHRNLTVKEEWAMCCVFWDDYTCLGYPMPDACTKNAQTRQSICHAACTAFDIANPPATRDRPHCVSSQYQTEQIENATGYWSAKYWAEYAESHHRPTGCVWQPFCWRAKKRGTE